MYSSKHFEATGGHIGTPSPTLFACWGEVCNLTSHTKSNFDDHTAKLNQGGRKITRVYRRSRKSRKTIIRYRFTINTSKKKENTSKYSPKLSTTHYKALIRHISLSKVYKKLYTGIIGWFLGSFTNFMIRQLSFSITKRSKKLQNNAFSFLVIYQRMQNKASDALYSVLCLILIAEEVLVNVAFFGFLFVPRKLTKFLWL